MMRQPHLTKALFIHHRPKLVPKGTSEKMVRYLQNVAKPRGYLLNKELVQLGLYAVVYNMNGRVSVYFKDKIRD